MGLMWNRRIVVLLAGLCGLLVVVLVQTRTGQATGQESYAQEAAPAESIEATAAAPANESAAVTAADEPSSTTIEVGSAKAPAVDLDKAASSPVLGPPNGSPIQPAVFAATTATPGSSGVVNSEQAKLQATAVPPPPPVVAFPAVAFGVETANGTTNCQVAPKILVMEKRSPAPVARVTVPQLAQVQPEAPAPRLAPLPEDRAINATARPSLDLKVPASPDLAPPLPPRAPTQHIEELVGRLKTLEAEKIKHLAAAEQLEKEKKEVASEIQKRLAEQKQQLEEMAGTPSRDAKGAGLSGKTETSPLLPKLDSILERLDKLEKRLNQLQSPELLPSPQPRY